MKQFLALAVFGGSMLAAQVAPIPMMDEMPGQPFAIRHTWVIGGDGNWGYLTLDPTARQLFIAHGQAVQVVDVETGNVLATIGGFRDARQVVLDPNSGNAYVLDAGASLVKVIDRGTYQVQARIATGPRPRSMVLEPSTGLLLAICGDSAAGNQGQDQDQNQDSDAHASDTSRAMNASRRAAAPRAPRATMQYSTITMIDPQNQEALADMWFAGRLGFAQADGRGRVFVTLEDGTRIARFDVEAMQNVVEKRRGAAADAKSPRPKASTPLKIDNPPEEVVTYFQRIGGGCADPRSIAVDQEHQRLFVACTNQKMLVLDSERGRLVTSVTIGPGADVIAYDASRQLIYTANGGGYGSLSVIRQHVTDTYAVIQTLPTLQQARTMAVDPSTGEVYLVTTLYGADIANTPANGIGKLKMDAVNGSFQVLVIGPS